MFLFRNSTFFILSIPGNLYISCCLENGWFFIFDGVMYTLKLVDLSPENLVCGENPQPDQ